MGTCSIRRGWLGTGGDRVTCPSPLAGTPWGQASFPACSAIHGAHTAPSSFPAAQEPPPAPRELPGSGDNSSCGWILHAGPLLEAVGDCRSNQQPFPWASLVHSEHHKLHAFICFLVPAHPGEKLHPPTCPSMGEATKTCPCTPVGPSSRAGSSTCEVPRIWGDLAVQKPRCSHSAPLPAAQEQQGQPLAHRESTSLAEHTGRGVKGVWDTSKREELLDVRPQGLQPPEQAGRR